MGTRSNIGIVKEGGTIDAVYCHAHGYPEGVGARLAANYYDEEVVAEMMELGAMSILRETFEDSVFYRRDRGETYATAGKMTYDSLPTAVESLAPDIEWFYLFADDQWWIHCCGSEYGFYRVEDALIAVYNARPGKHHLWVCKTYEFADLMAAAGMRPRMFTGAGLPQAGVEGWGNGETGLRTVWRLRAPNWGRDSCLRRNDG